MPAKSKLSTLERIQANAKPVGECLLWQGPPTRAGYGLIWLNGKNVQVHRAAYEASKGPIPTGLVVLHSCDNRLCVNSAHLTAGTHAANTADMVSKGRDVKASGEDHGMAKLTDAQVAEIRRRYVPRDKVNGGSALAREFGISQPVLSSIVLGKHRK